VRIAIIGILVIAHICFAEEFNTAKAIVAKCGVDNDDRTSDCWDVYNNCAVSAAFKRGDGVVTEADFKKCDANYASEYKRIDKLKTGEKDERSTATRR
jgi:hypothetical protein